MTALYIILGIVLVFAILLNCPVRADISYIGEKLDIKVKYLFLTLYPVKEKPPKKIKETEIEPSEEPVKEESFSGEEAEESIPLEEEIPEEPKKLTREEKKRLKRIEKRRKQREKEELKEKIELIMTLIKSSGKGVKKLISSISIYNIAIDFTVANEDAYDAALGYGKMNIIVFNALNFVRTFFTVSIEHINISCKYNSSESVYDGSCSVRANPAKVLGAAISVASRFGIAIFKNRRAEKKEKKKAEKEMKKNPQTA